MPKKTLDLIRSTGCHFLTQVKANCRSLYGQIALFTALATPITTCEYYENKHGHEVNRIVEVYENNAQLPKGWNGITRLVKVRRWGKREGKRFHDVALYMMSEPVNSAAKIAIVVQGHWSVENNLHWLKDVNMGEDNMTIKNPPRAAILAMLNNIAVNILAKAGLKPTKDTFANISNKVHKLKALFEFS